MPGLVPGIPIDPAMHRQKNRDGRDKPGHDVSAVIARSESDEAIEE
jgi:hypothetical protein